MHGRRHVARCRTRERAWCDRATCMRQLEWPQAAHVTLAVEHRGRADGGRRGRRRRCRRLPFGSVARERRRKRPQRHESGGRACHECAHFLSCRAIVQGRGYRVVVSRTTVTHIRVSPQGGYERTRAYSVRPTAAPGTATGETTPYVGRPVTRSQLALTASRHLHEPCRAPCRVTRRVTRSIRRVLWRPVGWRHDHVQWPSIASGPRTNVPAHARARR